MNPSTPKQDLVLPPNTAAWTFQVWAAFLVSVLALGMGLYYAPLNRWIQGFFLMGMFFTIGSTFTLAKTIRDNRNTRIDTPAWVFQSWAAFLLSAGITFGGIAWLPADVGGRWVQGCLAVAFFFCINTSFTLSKTIRDNHEAEKILSNGMSVGSPMPEHQA
ncbi:MAG TPA: YiaA/YiaB family inner membrane protein [Thermoanaerobaculia bacterium]|nr:YiaA/YiaB family inner membrane protein [Thermoanaerobaculia bacterium]